MTAIALAVVPLERGNGLGTALLRRSLQIGARGMDTATLRVNVAHLDSLHLYTDAEYGTVQVYQAYERKIA